MYNWQSGPSENYYRLNVQSSQRNRTRNRTTQQDHPGQFKYRNSSQECCLQQHLSVLAGGAALPEISLLTKGSRCGSLRQLTYGELRQRAQEGGSKAARRGGKWQENAKKILNRGNELDKSFRINKSCKKRTQNELVFEHNNA